MTATPHPALVAVLAAGATLLLLLAVRAWVVEPLAVSGGSMAPTLRPGQQVLVEKVTPWRRPWRRGDLVLFDRPGDGLLSIKRVVGLAGDTVAIRDGRLVVDGAPVPEGYAPPRRIDGVYFGPVTVPDGQVFVLGDDRRNSLDSRRYGTVPADDLAGRVVLRLWPLDRVGSL